MNGLTLYDRIGVSTLCLKGIPLPEVIKQISEAGFSAIELTPIAFGGSEKFGPSARKTLRDLLGAFRLVTVHSSEMGGANICSIDPEHREWSRQRYLELAIFATDVGADILTFHPGRAEAEGLSEEEIRSENVAFGKTLLEAVGDKDIKLGYELFDIRVAGEIAHPKFGLLFDLGHASCRGPDVDTSDVLEMVDLLAAQIVQFHVHGVGGANKKDHLPFSQNTYLDYDRIAKQIKGLAFSGPLIFEIGIWREDWEQNLKDCLSARNELMRAW